MGESTDFNHITPKRGIASSQITPRVGLQPEVDVVSLFSVAKCLDASPKNSRSLFPTDFADIFGPIRPLHCSGGTVLISPPVRSPATLQSLESSRSPRICIESTGTESRCLEPLKSATKCNQRKERNACDRARHPQSQQRSTMAERSVAN